MISYSSQEPRHFADKGLYSQSYGFSTSHGGESWMIKKVERQRIDDFDLLCWRGEDFLRVPWPARRSIPSTLKEINPELEGLMLKL